MFDIGFWEILLILVLALVIIGPERLPGAARKAGMFVGKARRYIEGVRTEVEEGLDVGEFKRLLHNQEVQINELQQQIKSGVDEVTAELPNVPDISDAMPRPYKESLKNTAEAISEPRSEAISENGPEESQPRSTKLETTNTEDALTDETVDVSPAKNKES